ncbi:hypothetical protein EDB83DRAFT_1015250 [Lactarius deliciosus]|nr:hypothetical protein EDB83DRAFT_1015250 [Lactarius deliciosus]
MFEWNWDSVAAECTSFLGPAGYVSPDPNGRQITGLSRKSSHPSVAPGSSTRTLATQPASGSSLTLYGTT